jgi:hypothetical protein
MNTTCARALSPSLRSPELWFDVCVFEYIFSQSIDRPAFVHLHSYEFLCLQVHNRPLGLPSHANNPPSFGHRPQSASLHFDALTMTLKRPGATQSSSAQGSEHTAMPRAGVISSHELRTLLAGAGPARADQTSCEDNRAQVDDGTVRSARTSGSNRSRRNESSNHQRRQRKAKVWYIGIHQLGMLKRQTNQRVNQRALCKESNDWLVAWLLDWPVNHVLLIDRLTNGVIDYLIYWLLAWLIDSSPNVCVCVCVYCKLHGMLQGQTNQRVNQLTLRKEPIVWMVSQLIAGYMCVLWTC